jgi:hypothetical protein
VNAAPTKGEAMNEKTLTGYAQGAQVARSLTDAEAASERWAAAKGRLDNARAAAAGAQEELEAANRDEQIAWDEMANVSGRGCPTPAPVSFRR